MAEGLGRRAELPWDSKWSSPSVPPLPPSSLVPATQHPQQLAGLHALLLSHRLHIEAHVHKELRHVHLLPCELVPDGRAGGIAVGPGATVYQVEGAALHGGFAGLMAVMEASIPAVQCPGQ